MTNHATPAGSFRLLRRPTSPAIVLLLLLGSLTIAGGCVTTTTPASPARPKRAVTVKTESPDRVAPKAAPINQPNLSPKVSPSSDDCPKALHELCGPLLLYFASHRQLPPALDALRDIAGETEPALAITCPKSGRPYTYNPASRLRDGQGDRVIIYDATPAHAQGRWAIAIREPVPGKPLVMKVIPIADELFLKWQAAASEVPPTEVK